MTSGNNSPGKRTRSGPFHALYAGFGQEPTNCLSPYQLHNPITYTSLLTPVNVLDSTSWRNIRLDALYATPGSRS
ncbi:Methylenetetrahydrofolate reductase 1 [Fusarium oxysporum f. sp. albedinis]|nr:Methylenetetrahydrofolate reductase 1 [Fusarium oxysporum f. sp. albedinis]